MNVKRLSAVSIGHLAIDILNSSVAMVLTALAGPFQLANSQIAFGVMLYALVGSLTQPYFGWLADRFAGRWLGAVGLLWTAVFFAGASVAPNYPLVLVLMGVAALGSGAFHPQGAMNASDAGRGRASSATAVFFLFGQAGLALGPVFSGVVIQYVGLHALPLMALVMAPAALLMLAHLRQPMQVHELPSSGPLQTAPAEQEKDPPARRASRSRWLVVVAFGLVVALRATVQQGYYGLLPKFYADQGFQPAEYGAMVGVFSMALAVGTLVGGVLGDTISHRRLVLWSTLLCAPFTFVMLDVQGWSFFFWATMAGLLVGMPHSILVVMAQQLLPRRQGLASGAVLGFMFAAGAAGTGIAGWAADWIGLPAALHGVALLPLVAGLSAFFLRDWEKTAPAALKSPAVGVSR